MADSKKLKSSMKIKVVKSFMNPMTNRMAEIDHVMNVPKGRFWFKRIKDGDCIEVKTAAKIKNVKTESNQKTNKGSK